MKPPSSGTLWSSDEPAADGPRFFCPGDLSQGATRELPPQAAHHALRVLRLSVGDGLVVFNGEGTQAQAQITFAGKSGVTVRIGGHRARDLEPPFRITLAQSISSRERMDFTVQKAVELGVAEIWPIASRRSVVRLEAERANRRVEHWQNLVISACEQCGRNVVPTVHPIMDLPSWLVRADGKERRGTQLRLVLSPRAEARLRDLSAPAEVLMLAGPEGGFEPEELALAETFAFRAVRLGPRVLRTETAALAALAAMHALWGDF